MPTRTLPPEAERYRDEVRAFLDEHAPRGRYPADWNRRLADAGIAWGAHVGGLIGGALAAAG